jgi:hypothetical protein
MMAAKYLTDLTYELKGGIGSKGSIAFHDNVTYRQNMEIPMLIFHIYI